jgi:hypothetical protein
LTARSRSQDWYIPFKKEGPWSNPKCDSANKTLCSDLFHNQEQSPGYPHGDGDCLAPACDTGSVPSGFYVFNHSTTTVVKGQTFQDCAWQTRVNSPPPLSRE